MTAPVSPAHAILGRLTKVRKAGKGWLACCPAHDDKSPSLSIAESDDGKVLLHCHGGCAVGDVLAAMGLDWKDLFADSLSPALKREYRRKAATAALDNARIGMAVCEAGIKAGPLSAEDAAFYARVQAEASAAEAALQALEAEDVAGAGAPALGVERHPFADGEFIVTARGVHFSNDNGSTWLCSPLHIVAETRDEKSVEWGRLLQWPDNDGVLHTWAMPMELLQGDGNDLRRELARQGLSIATGRRARELLCSYLNVWPVDKRARCVGRLGWHGAVYVRPFDTIGDNAETVVFQNVQAIEPAFAVAGTVDEWRASVAALAAGNSRLVLALCVALAGPLAHIAGEDGGGFHLRGASSSGKTTALRAAASVWGHPTTYIRQWRATTNGLEGLATLHNDGLLILDELGQIDPKEVGDAAYMLANGHAKARASRTGAARAAATWRLLLLSAGEVSLGALMALAGKRPNAGQEIRLADIDADAGAGMGVFETLHGIASPAALSQAVREAACQYHGAVGVAWLRHIVADREGLAALIADGVAQFVAEAVPADAGGQAQRVAVRFALAAVAGELATAYGLTGWHEGEADKAAKACFASWLAAFGGVGNREERALFDQVRGFFEAHGSSRFEDVRGDAAGRVIFNRVGYVRTTATGEREYLVLPEAFKNEVCKGFDPKMAEVALVKAGWIMPGGDGRPTRKTSLPGAPKTRVYVFAANEVNDAA